MPTLRLFNQASHFAAHPDVDHSEVTWVLSLQEACANPSVLPPKAGGTDLGAFVNLEHPGSPC